MRPQLTLLGMPSVTWEGHRKAVPLLKPAYLLLYLSYVGEWVSRDELLEVFRPTEDDLATRGSLRLLLTRARRLEWAHGLEIEPRRLRWSVPTDVGTLRSAINRQDWAHAADAYHAPLLRGLPAGEALPGFHEWLEVERAALQTAWLQVVRYREDELVGQGDLKGAAQLLERALGLEPLSEDMLQRYLQVSHLAGEREAGLRTYSRFADRLRSELGLTPLPGTLDLVSTLQRSAERLNAEGQAAPDRAASLDVIVPTFFVGRDAELAMVRHAPTPAVVVMGDPGIGKTRLLAEAVPGLHPVRCQEGLEHVPFFPVLAAVRARLSHLPNLGPYRGDLARFLPELGSDDGVQMPEQDDSGKLRLLEALARVFEQEGRVVVEDLHWADPATLEWLTFLVRRGGVQVYGTCRPGEARSELREVLRALAAETTVVRLAPLNADEIASLARAVTGHGAADRDLAPWLAARSDGNPLVALEWLRALWQAGTYERLGGVWTRTARSLPDFGAVPVPQSLSDLVMRRVDVLLGIERRVLDLASVLGSHLKPQHLAAVLDESEWIVGEAMARAERLGLLRGEGFTHDLVRHVLYGALPDVQRRLMHARAARALEGQLDDLVVAEHALLGGDEARAARLWLSAATRSFGVRPGFEDEAIRLFERVVSLEIRTPEWYRACVGLALRRRSGGEIEEARELLELVLRESDDPEARAVAHAESAILAYLDGNLGKATELVGLAAQEAAEVDDVDLQRGVRLMQVSIAQRRGDWTDALRVAQQTVEELRREPLRHATCNWLSLLGALLCDVGRFEEALTLYHEQLAAGRFLKLRAEQVKASSDIIATLHDLGRIQEGVELAEEALSLGHVADSFSLRYHLALAYGRGGRRQEALEHAQAVWQESPSVNTRAHACALLAELYAAEDPAQAQKILLDGLTAVEGCDILTAHAIVVIAVLQFGSAAVLARAQPMLAGMHEDALPAYLRGDFVKALADRPEARTAP